ncbi:hypothetical protein VRU48_13605 [Pedobacter sp. KR3-3]|uniref:Uncharacterized protein n=1 Tax=Pedobacter albus TaxID=3113905 RepID=A0ABU7I9K1_9SPHI|nr:hypothetical protein [Pedobacter sp. KR3-3]MEE1946153.1 hypothetical protein [Pedobacter sp. KR3-3]
MKTITIKGRFPEEGNRSLTLCVYCSNAELHPYDFKKVYRQNFTEVFSDLGDNSRYYIDLDGYVEGELKIEVSGEFKSPNLIKETMKDEGFSRGFTIRTN